MSSDVFRVPDSSAGAASWEDESLWVLRSWLGPFGTALGRVCVMATPVWSSERLFPANADKEQLNYPLTPTFTLRGTSAPPSSSQDYSGSGLFWSER